MQPYPAIPDTFQKKFDQMWRSACRVCDNILAFQPDLLVALMHSGWGPVYSAQTLWSQTQTLPFPPLARPNLGREKINIFDETFNMLVTYSFVGEYSSAIEVGRLLAWLTGRKDWMEQLRQQVIEARQTSADPQRILVVDECIHEGSTAILALGLLKWIYPQATLCLLDARSWVHSEYLDFMLAAFPDISGSFPNGKVPSQEVHSHLDRIAIGSEDVSADSLFWRPVSVDSPSVLALSVYRPAADWVQASRAIYASIGGYIQGRSASYLPRQPDPHDIYFHLTGEWCMMRDIWLEDGITRRQAEQRYGLSSREVARIFDKWMEFDDIALEGHGRWARYRIPLPLQRYINKLEEMTGDRLPAYWLLPGRLMFGYRPWYLVGRDGVVSGREDIRAILDSGVDGWLDVQIVQEGSAPEENPLFLEEAQAIGRAAIKQTVALAIQYVSQENHTLTRRGRPNRKDVRRVLDQIDQLLDGGRILYVSTKDNALRGILAGCYLARHGQSGNAALAALQARRATAANGWKREPASTRARRYVRSWPAGL